MIDKITKKEKGFKLTKGWGPWKKTWYSVCSAHYKYNSNCHMCNAGSYVTAWRQWISSYVYNRFPRFWRWWVNK